MNEQHKLDLGRFNKCVEYLPNGSPGHYPIDSGSKVLYYMSEEGDIASTDLAKFSICVPTFDIGVATSLGNVDTPSTINTLLAHIDLKIMAMIRKIVFERNIESALDHMRIMVKNIQFFNDDALGSGCYGWAEIGIAATVPSQESVQEIKGG